MCILGGCVNLSELRDLLNSHTYDMVCMTHVDTSTGVLNDVKNIAALVHQLQPNAFIAVIAIYISLLTST